MKITEYFVKNPRITNMIMALIILSGIFTAMTLKREQFPPVSFDIVEITTQYPGASPEDVEINVTNKIEDQLLEVQNIKNITSMSMENISVIILQIDSDHGDPVVIKQDVRDAVERVSDLPAAVTEDPVIREIRSTNLPVMEISVTGGNSELELRKYARDLESLVKEVSGVSSVEKIGYRKREIKIDVNLNKMKDDVISFNDVMQAIKARNVRSSGGTIESYVSEKQIMTLSEYENLHDISSVIIRSNVEGYSVKISDIARITDDFEEPRIMYRGNGKPAIALIISQQDNVDVITLKEVLLHEIHEFKKNLPENVKVETIYDYSIFTDIMLNMVLKNGILGFILVLLVMFIFLDRVSAFWSAFGIPFSIIGAMILFKPFGINLNVITLSTMILLLGIIVDDAIVVTEKIYSLKQQGVESHKATMDGIKAMALPVSAAVFTTMLAFGPIFFIPGMMGKFTSGIPLTVIIILSFSLAEALLFIPAHVCRAKVRTGIPKKSLWVEFLKKKYGHVLTLALNKRIIVISGFIILLLSMALLSASALRFMLDEDIDIDFFAIVIETPQGTPLNKTKDMIPQIEKLVIETIPHEELQSITTQIGHHNIQPYAATGGQYSNWAAVNIFLKPAAQRRTTSEHMMQVLGDKLKKINKKNKFQRLDIEPIAGLPIGKAVNLTFITNDDHLRKNLEIEAVSLLKKTKGVSLIESSTVPGKDIMRIVLDYKKLALVGLTALDVAQTVRTAFDGTIATSIRKDGEDIDLRVRVQDQKRFRAEGILNLPVANHQGRLIMMKHFAHIEETSGPAVIHHSSGKRSVTITADTDPDIITSLKVNSMLKEKFEPLISGKSGLRMKLGGQQEETAQSMQGVLYAMIVVIISIYFILVVIFNSYGQPLLIMSIIPFAVLFGFMTLIIHGRPLIFISLMGIMGLIGVVVNDTIVMISHINNIIISKGSTLQNIIAASVDRFRPVILTTLTTFAGLLPTCYGLGGDLPSIRPMVLVLAWGLLFSTVVTLIFIPVLVSFFHVRKKQKV